MFKSGRYLFIKNLLKLLMKLRLSLSEIIYKLNNTYIKKKVNHTCF